MISQPATPPQKLVRETLPIAVLIPTRNSGALLPGHLQSLREWVDLAEEIVVVDSHSHDGTQEMLRAGLSHPRVTFLTHPPGLYQSWNFGIQNVSAKYVYVATVGDPISRRGIQHLYEVAEEFQSDIVISKPDFIGAAGQPLPGDHWPIDVILNGLKIERPQLLSTAELFVFTASNPWGAVLGSSASNLYLASCLKARPFPTEYGTAGDVAWGIQNVFEVTLAVTPERISSFRQHEKAYALSEYHVESLIPKLSQLVQTVVARKKETNPAVLPLLQEIRWLEHKQALDALTLWKLKLEEYRNGFIPWFLIPAAWAARSARDRAGKAVADIHHQWQNRGWGDLIPTLSKMDSR